MKYSYIQPPLPSFARWRKIYAQKKDLSCLRAMEYEKLQQMELDGRVLDVGGGQDFSLYQKLLPEHLAYDLSTSTPIFGRPFLSSLANVFRLAMKAMARVCA